MDLMFVIILLCVCIKLDDDHQSAEMDDELDSLLAEMDGALGDE